MKLKKVLTVIGIVIAGFICCPLVVVFLIKILQIWGYLAFYFATLLNIL